MYVKTNSRGQKSRDTLIQAAIECIAELGVHRATFDAIAKKAKVNQPNVVYHFGTKDKIFPIVWDYVYQRALAETLAKINFAQEPIQQLLNYCEVSVEFFLRERALTILYFQLHHMAVFDPQLREMNTKIKRVAVNRIANIILEGQRAGKFSHVDPYVAAKAIHSSLVGVIINSITENEDFSISAILNELKNLIQKGLVTDVASEQ